MYINFLWLCAATNHSVSVTSPCYCFLFFFVHQHSWLGMMNCAPVFALNMRMKEDRKKICRSMNENLYTYAREREREGDVYVYIIVWSSKKINQHTYISRNVKKQSKLVKFCCCCFVTMTGSDKKILVGILFLCLIVWLFKVLCGFFWRM